MFSLFVDESGLEHLINDQTFIMLAVVGLCVSAAVLGVAFSVWLNKFSGELKRVNQRIRFSESEREREHYIKRRRRLFLSIIPFVKYHHRSKSGRSRK